MKKILLVILCLTGCMTNSRWHITCEHHRYYTHTRLSHYHFTDNEVVLHDPTIYSQTQTDVICQDCGKTVGNCLYYRDPPVEIAPITTFLRHDKCGNIIKSELQVQSSATAPVGTNVITNDDSKNFERLLDKIFQDSH
jgi:hypothetical protein